MLTEQKERAMENVCVSVLDKCSLLLRGTMQLHYVALHMHGYRHLNQGVEGRQERDELCVAEMAQHAI